MLDRETDAIEEERKLRETEKSSIEREIEGRRWCFSKLQIDSLERGEVSNITYCHIFI